MEVVGEYNTMAKPGRIKEIEREFNEPFKPLVLRLLNERKSIPKVAEYIGFDQGNLFRWCQRNGIVKEIRWVDRRTPNSPRKGAPTKSILSTNGH